MRRNIAVALAAVPSALLLTAAPALASSSDGTVHLETPQTCYSFGTTTICDSFSGQFNTTTTPSGNTSLVGKSTYNLSVTDGASTFSESLSSNGHFLDTPDGTQEASGRISDSFNFNGQMCSYTDAYHYANGNIQFDRPDFSCT